MQLITLKDFNNLSKTVSISLYKVYYVKSLRDRKKYFDFIIENNSEKLASIFKGWTNSIGANILSISKQDYNPLGNSVNILISEGKVEKEILDLSCNEGDFLVHLDKSHISLHTYPEIDYSIKNNVYRLDIDIQTCGNISPINLAENIINTFNPDVISIDYKVRGINREGFGKFDFGEKNLNEISLFLSKDTKSKYDLLESIYKDGKISFAKLRKKDLDNSNCEEEVNYIFDKCIL
ncbi:MAG: S-adenosylmethionine decarboxylase [Clostridium sp.]|uniref:S-adenosylmethionine decarboxylase n=1 Tax=Clostridium TaxID=1485 RepID=UPI002152D59E|nr:S-adenosylmethionine decarboxylase [Clostridium sp. LY3-2]MCR6515506.1 S-adenosylmethionine decarboxylase [Clostridium sp. LY3-2]